MKVILVRVLLALLSAQANGASDASHVIRANQPASDFNSALPIGNGRLGAMLYGNAENEIIHLNEDSIWDGAWVSRTNPDSFDAFQKVRSLMDQNLLSQADSEWRSGMVSNPIDTRVYQPAGDLRIKTDHDAIQDYHHSLDIATGLWELSYSYNGVKYTRRAIANAPANVIAFDFSSDSDAAVSMSVALTRDQATTSITYEDDSIILRGHGTADEAYTFTSRLNVVANGGSKHHDGQTIIIEGAQSVQLYWSAETVWYNPGGASEYEPILERSLNEAVSTGFSALLQQATDDYKQYYERTTLDLGDSGNNGAVDTRSRLSQLQQSRDINSDPELIALIANYGRYLTISSSRPGTQAPNLQGIWNKDFSPAWGSKYTININLQMNSWSSDPSGLGEMLHPLWDLLDRMRIRGRQVAKSVYGADGWVCHHNTDIHGDCDAVGDSTFWASWPMGGAWLLSTASEHFRFTRDIDFARNVALPLISEAITFYNNFTVLSGEGYREVFPSNSPEHPLYIPDGQPNAGSTTGLDKATQMDRALLHDLYSSFIELSDAVGSSAGLSDAQTFLQQVQGPTVNPSTGRLLEWSQDFGETEAGHRHFSPIYGLHPGHQYSPLHDAEYANAASELQKHRIANGGASTGWSRAWSAAIHARLFDSEGSVDDLTTLLTDFTYANMFTITSGTFQIDANFGATHAVQEMLLQSHMNETIHIGPALSSSRLSSGSFAGLKARGGYTIDAQWSGGQVNTAKIVAGVDGPLAIRLQDGRPFNVNGSPYSGPINAQAGNSYEVTPI